MHINNIILIDDDPMCNFLTGHAIHRCNPEIDLQEFVDPGKALDYIALIIADDNKKSIILLDIRMPGLTGWAVLDQLAIHTDQIKKNFRVYMLSSSIDPRDIEKANENKLVTGYFEKPLTIMNIEAICGQEA